MKKIKEQTIAFARILIRIFTRRKKSRFANNTKTKKKKPSAAQKLQMIKFRMITELLSPMLQFLPVSYGTLHNSKAARGKAFSYHLKNAIEGELPYLKINYEAVRVSKGALYNSHTADAYASSGKIHYTWGNVIINNVAENDISMLVVYCPVLKKCVYETKGPTRKEGKAVIDVSKFKGRVVHTYLSFISADGKLVSDSKYTGRFSIN
jgi:hypothetical protein